jgi:protein SCO1/2
MRRGLAILAARGLRAHSGVRRALAIIVAIVALPLAAGCSGGGDAWHTRSIAGLMPDLQFAMTDDRGDAVTAGDYQGQTVLLFFGYTNCTDVCPATLARLAEAARAMHDHGAGVRVLFVTVDPARDTVSRLSAYVHSFGAGFTGLRGSRAAIDELTRRYRVAYSLGTPDANGQYEVLHSSAVFVFDRDGRARLMVRPDDPVAAITADLDRLDGG